MNDPAKPVSHPNDHPANPQQSYHKAPMFLWAVSLTCALTAFHFGYSISAINVPSKVFFTCPSVQQPQSFSFLAGCFPVSEEAWGLVGMGLPLGGWIGGFSAPSLMKSTRGLKQAIQFLNFILIVAYLVMSFAINLSMLITGRLLFGLVSGASGMLVPLYLSSVAPLRYRGFFTNFFQLFLCGGIVVAELISLISGAGKRQWIWRFTFGAGIFVVLLQTVLDVVFGFLPPCPRDLDYENGTGASSLLRNRLGFTLAEETTTATSAKDSDSLRYSDSKHPLNPSIPELRPNESIWDLITFKIPQANKSLLLGIILHLGQQISGVNVIFFYSSMIIVGSESIPLLLSLINFGMTFVAVWLLDRSGRRPVALFSAAGVAACLLAISAGFSFPSLTRVVAPFLVAFIACFAVGLGPIPWLILPEIFPPTWHLTPTAISICVSANWITNILVAGTFPSINKILPASLIFFFFGISCTFLLIALNFFLPETKNKPSNFIK